MMKSVLNETLSKIDMKMFRNQKIIMLGIFCFLGLAINPAFSEEKISSVSSETNHRFKEIPIRWSTVPNGAIYDLKIARDIILFPKKIDELQKLYVYNPSLLIDEPLDQIALSSWKIGMVEPESIEELKEKQKKKEVYRFFIFALDAKTKALQQKPAETYKDFFAMAHKENKLIISDIKLSGIKKEYSFLAKPSPSDQNTKLSAIFD